MADPAPQRLTSGVDERVEFRDFAPPVVDMATEVLAGLTGPDKTILPKYFYDERGSQLFDEITRLEEYYPTRTETGILGSCRDEVAALVGPAAFMVEYGSGTSTKVRLLLERLRPSGYMPIDISREFLLAAARTLAADYPWLRVYPTCADYGVPANLPAAAHGHAVMAFFPGSSIGNYDPGQAETFLRNVATTVGKNGYFLIGVDRKKDAAVLERAYNDESGITDAFNLNIIKRLNRALDGTLRPDAFRHLALYNESRGRIEMHLECTAAHQADLAGTPVSFAVGERIHTESSYKYTPAEFEQLAARAGFTTRYHFTDPGQLFSVFLLQASA